MTEAELRLAFVHAVENARWWRNQYVEVKEASTQEGGSDARLAETGRSFFGSLSETLFIHAHPANWTDPDRPMFSLPRDLAHTIGGLFGYVAVGKMPEPISDAIVRRGRTRFGPGEEKAVRIATSYIAAVRAGIIDDRHEVKTVCEAYGVSRTSVRGWVHAFPSPFPLDLVDGDASRLRDAVSIHGERHRQAGRSEAAIKVRNKRR